MSMGKRAKALATAGLMMVLGCPANGMASDAKDQSRARYAAFSCEQYLRSNLKIQEIYKSWVENYIDRFVETTPDVDDVLDLMDIEGMMSEIAKNCQLTPSARFSVVVAVTIYAYYAIHKVGPEKSGSSLN